ncbi:MAG: hypothetical protein EBT67_13150, partial [Betaproteobacteria bacterium]|nr:hypothetical protein [Betaproteobacteria bacterium]
MGDKKVETFNVTVDDGKGGTVDQLVTVTITGTNDDPVITSEAVTQEILQGSAGLTSITLFDASATDADDGNKLTYSLVDAREYFIISKTTGE